MCTDLTLSCELLPDLCGFCRTPGKVSSSCPSSPGCSSCGRPWHYCRIIKEQTGCGENLHPHAQMWCVYKCRTEKKKSVCSDNMTATNSLCTCSDALFVEFKGLTLGTKIPDFYQILTAPIMKVCSIQPMHMFGSCCFNAVDCPMTSLFFCNRSSIAGLSPNL